MTDWLLYLQLGQAFNGLKGPEDSEDPQGLDGIYVFACCPSVQIKGTVSLDEVVWAMKTLSTHSPVTQADCSTA